MPRVHWSEADEQHDAEWRSESQPAPRKVVIADDRMRAETAYRLVCEGTALLWRGTFPGARQLLQVMTRRHDRKPPRQGATPAETFHLHRHSRGQRARTLGMVLVELDPDHRVPLRRAPDARKACAQVYGPLDATVVVSLRELLGVISAYEWRRKGVEIPALGKPIHPHYGVFSPVRGEYVDLVATAPLPAGAGFTAFDIGTGTGVLAAVLAERGAGRVIATDIDPRAVACARENIGALGLDDRIEARCTDLFPAGRAALVVCNPPWVPARPSTPIEKGVYDPRSRMLRGFLDGLADHLEPGGEGWLVLSDFAEHLGLRPHGELLSAFEQAGLRVVDRIDTKPRHPRAFDADDALHRARAAETTSLWRLRP
ncbi:N5-glutamine methyltransferase family protein [Nocardiopsis ansamitocini]|uniref:Methylase n=1 Tax=Nocardiopsis ansamitocini TaxID=1670832 RepID=A0A9W6P7A9_9ACTN|nr:class I SAM-dependent methyltransferase [Nocardiopsis ansamitocini]GLU48323.1 methylase [Nocardiopsis ansamitocini]